MDKATIIDGTATPVAGNINLMGVLRIPAVRQIMLLLGVAAAVAAGFAIVLWSKAPGYAPLYSDLDNGEAAQVADALRSAEIRYKLDTETGTVLVDQSRLHDARLELAGQGFGTGASAGMDMIQEQSSFGVSQFMEGARYQYALEAELARTISHLGAVRDARVHLALPKQSAFIREQKSASASVLLQLFRGRMLEPDQASAIVNLVASSVPNLTSKNVTLIDQQGRLLSSGTDQWNDAQTVSQFKHTQRIEESYRSRIEDLLTPLVGPGRVRAQVVAELDFTVVEETRETYDPASTVVRSEQINEQQQRGSQANPAGVPGALSNQPPVAAADDALQANTGTPPTQEVNSSRAAVRNFEVDRTISRTRPQSGTIERLSIAVLVDDSPVEGVDEANQQPLTETDIERFTALVREAVGFNEARGDTVAVVNAAFRTLPEAPAPVEPAIWEKPIVQQIGKQAGGVILVLALAFGLVRPMLQNLVTSNMSSSSNYLASGGTSAAAVPAGAGNFGGGAVALSGPSYDEKVAAAKNITGHDPARVAQVVKKWVTADE